LDKCRERIFELCIEITGWGFSGFSGILFGEGSTNSVEDREKGDLGAVAP